MKILKILSQWKLQSKYINMQNKIHLDFLFHSLFWMQLINERSPLSNESVLKLHHNLVRTNIFDKVFWNQYMKVHFNCLNELCNTSGYGSPSKKNHKFKSKCIV